MLIKLQGYVLREIVKVLVLAIAGVAAMILLTLCVRLLREGMKPEQLQGILLYLLPFTLPFAIPCGILIASVMSFGRLAGDNELLAIRSSGINLWSVVWPITVLGLALTAGAEALNNNLLPWCQRRVAEKRQELIGPWLERLGNDVSVLKLRPYEVHRGSVDRSGKWQSVVAVKYADEFVAQLIVARSGSLVIDRRTQKGVMTLTNGYMIQPYIQGREACVSFPNDMSYTIDLRKGQDVGPPRNAELTLGQLMRQRAILMRRLKGEELASGLRMVSRATEHDLSEKVKQLNQLAARQSELAAEIERLNGELTQLGSRKSMLETRKKTAEDDAAGKKKVVAVQTESIAEAKRTMESLPANSQRRRDLSDQIAEMTGKRAAMQKAVAELEQTATQSAGELAAVADSLAKTQAAMAHAAGQKAQADAGVAEKVREREALRERMRKINTEEDLLAVNTQIHFRLAQGVACFVFALLGIPLGIMARRGGVMVPVGISFAVIICLYYPIYTMGRQMSGSGFIPAHIAMWLPNLVCGLLGGVLMVRTLRS